MFLSSRYWPGESDNCSLRPRHVQPQVLLLPAPHHGDPLPGQAPLPPPLPLAAPRWPHQAGPRGRGQGQGGQDPGGDGGHQEAEDRPLQVQVHHAEKWHQGKPRNCRESSHVISLAWVSVNLSVFIFEKLILESEGGIFLCWEEPIS